MLGSPKRSLGGLEEGGRGWGKAQGDGSSNAAVWLQKQLRAWDKGPRMARSRMVEEFVLDNRGIFAVDLEKKYGTGVSLFCLRVSAWLRLSAIAQQPNALPLQALSVFLYSAQGNRFATELVETGGLQPVFDILSNGYAREEERLEALLFLRGLTLHGQAFKEYLSREGAIRLAASYLTSSMPEEILELAASLLLDLGTANPVFFPEVYAALLAALTGCQREPSLLLAGHTFRMLIAPAVNKASGLDILLGKEAGEATSSPFIADIDNNTPTPDPQEMPSLKTAMKNYTRPTSVQKRRSGADTVSFPVEQDDGQNVVSPSVAPTKDSMRLLHNRPGSDASLPPLQVQRDTDNSLWKLSRTGHTPTRTPYNSPHAVEGPRGTIFDGSQLAGLKKQLAFEQEGAESSARRFRGSDAMLREGVVCGMRLLQTPDSKVQFEAFEILRTLGSIGTQGMSIVMDAVASCLMDGIATEKLVGPEAKASEPTPSETPLGSQTEEDSDSEFPPHLGKRKSESISSDNKTKGIGAVNPAVLTVGGALADEESMEDVDGQVLQPMPPSGGGDQSDSNSPCNEDEKQHTCKTIEDERPADLLEEDGGLKENTPAVKGLRDALQQVLHQRAQIILDENGEESTDEVASAYTIRGNPITTIDISPRKISYISCSPKRSPNRQRPSVMVKTVSVEPVESALEKAISRELSIRNLWSRGNFQKRADLLNQAQRLMESEDCEDRSEAAKLKLFSSASGGHEKSKPLGQEHKSGKGRQGEEVVVLRLHDVHGEHQGELLSGKCNDTQKMAAAKFLGVYVERSSSMELTAASLVEVGLVRALLVCLKLAMGKHQNEAPSCSSTAEPIGDECPSLESHRLMAVVMRTLQFLLSVSDLVRDFVRHVAGAEVLLWLCAKGDTGFDSCNGERVLGILDNIT